MILTITTKQHILQKNEIEINKEDILEDLSISKQQFEMLEKYYLNVWLKEFFTIERYLIKNFTIESNEYEILNFEQIKED